MRDVHTCLPSRFIKEIPSSLISSIEAGAEQTSTEDKLAALSALLARYKKS